MTEKRLRELFAEWQERLGLAHWRITVILGGATDDAEMTCERMADYERACIRVQHWLVGDGEQPQDINGGIPLTDEDVEITIVHELLHCQTGELRFADIAFERHLPKKVNKSWQIVQRRAEEAVVERLAVALVRAWRDGR